MRNDAGGLHNAETLTNSPPASRATSSGSHSPARDGFSHVNLGNPLSDCQCELIP